MLGEEVRVTGYALAGAIVMVADGPDEARRAWASVPAGTSLVVLTPASAEALGGELAHAPRDRLVVTMPR